MQRIKLSISTFFFSATATTKIYTISLLVALPIETHLAAGRGENIAFIESTSGKRISYGTLSANSGKVAGALTKAGIKREERAAILMLDSIDCVEVFWGCLKAGVIAVPINTLLASAV